MADFPPPPSGYASGRTRYVPGIHQPLPLVHRQVCTPSSNAGTDTDSLFSPTPYALPASTKPPAVVLLATPKPSEDGGGPAPVAVGPGAPSAPVSAAPVQKVTLAPSQQAKPSASWVTGPEAAGLAIAVALGWVVLSGRIVEWPAIAAFVIRERAAEARRGRRRRRTDRSSARERQYYAGMKPKRFAAEMARRRRQIDVLTRRSEILYTQADRHEAGRLNFAFYAALLRRRAQRHLDAAYALHDEIERLERLWAEIEAERNAEDRSASGEKIRALMAELESTDAVARRALAELNRLRASIDYEQLIPPALPAFARKQVINILRLLTGTSNLHEARNALAQVRRILNSHNVGWGQMAA